MIVPKRISGLDGLRAIAVILVFLDHKVPFFNRLEIGSAGVILFFVLSGYLITSILLRRRHEIDHGRATQWDEILRFFKNRSFRILPAYLAMILIVTALTKLGLHLVMYKDVPCYLTFTTNFCVKAWQMWPPLGHFWSLAIEEQFYLLSAPLFLLTPSRHARTVVAGLLGVAILTFCLETAAGATSITVRVDSFVNFGMLALGSGVAIAARVGNATASRWVLAGLGLLVLVKGAPVLLGTSETMTNVLQQVLGLSAGVVIWATVANQQSKAVAVLQWTPLRYLGRVSYAFYLWHLSVVFAFPPAAAAWLNLDPAIALSIECLAEFFATVAIAALSWKLLEDPMLRLRDATLGGVAPSPALRAVSAKGRLLFERLVHGGARSGPRATMPPVPMRSPAPWSASTGLPTT